MDKSNRGLLIVFGVLILVFLIGPLLGGGMMGQGMMGGYGPQGMFGANGWAWGLVAGLGLLSMLAFWGALIVGVVMLVRWFGGTISGRDGKEEDQALETLRRRYAAGEISHEEYEQRRKVLEREQ